LNPDAPKGQALWRVIPGFFAKFLIKLFQKVLVRYQITRSRLED